MIGMQIANFFTEECQFSVPSDGGSWDFQKVSGYEKIIQTRKPGFCATTFVAINERLDLRAEKKDLEISLRGLSEICLILSFLIGNCVTAYGSTGDSDFSFIELGDLFIPVRAIEGPAPLKIKTSFSDIFANGVSLSDSRIDKRHLRLLISNWLSGMTCYVLEDLYSRVCTCMEIVKQIEIDLEGQHQTLKDGMVSASQRFGLNPLQDDFKDMRNDLVHDGRLSGARFRNKKKSDCAQVIQAVLRWLDHYLISVYDLDSHIESINRYQGAQFESFPSISFGE